MLPVLLALACALCYGASDYTSGRAVRQAGLLEVTITAEVTRAVLVIAVVPLASSQSPSPASLAWGAAAGVSGVAGIMALNMGFRHTAFSVVSPISAIVAAAIPVLAGLHLGERLSPLSLAGVVLALPAILVVSARGEAGTDSAQRAGAAVSPAPATVPQAGPGGITQTRSRGTATGRHLAGVLWAVTAGAGFGLSLTALNRAGSATDLWPLVAAELAAVATVATMAVATGNLALPPGEARGLAVQSGATAAVGLFCYFLATHHGPLSVTAVIYAFFPAGTILLARARSGERLTKVRLAGLGLAAASVCLIVLGGGR